MAGIIIVQLGQTPVATTDGDLAHETPEP